MAFRLTINADRVKQEIRDKVADGITRATVFLHSQCRLAVNVPNTGVRVRVKDIHKQAAEQLGDRDRGLIRYKGQRTSKGLDGKKQKEGYTAWYFYNKKTLTNRKTATVYPYPSKPGEPPRKRTGWGQNHIVWDVDRAALEGRVGISVNAMYMLFLELGTRRMRPRPWLVATYEKLKSQLNRLILAEAA
jgi:hypothetical protein